MSWEYHRSSRLLPYQLERYHRAVHNIHIATIWTMAASAKERKQKSRAKLMAKYGLRKFRQIQNKQKAAQRKAKKEKMTDAEKIVLRAQLRVSKAQWRAAKRDSGDISSDSGGICFDISCTCQWYTLWFAEPAASLIIWHSSAYKSLTWACQELTKAISLPGYSVGHQMMLPQLLYQSIITKYNFY